MKEDSRCTLTISILASGRETILTGLKSIKPLLDEIDCQLIIVDTGCSKKLLEEIRKYTGSIVEFTWCNDFSKARNAGLKYAKGRWFMYFDDDEWFNDVNPIIDFFKSEEEEKYNRFQYLVRNYQDEDGEKWVEQPVDRGMRLFEGMEFTGVIHEHINITDGPVKIIDTFVHHFGYVYKTEEEKKNHGRRNIPLVLKELERNPRDARTYAHIIQEYNAIEDYEKSYNYSVKGCTMCESEENPQWNHISMFLVNQMFCLQKMGRTKDAYEKALAALNSDHMTNLGKAMIWFFLNGYYMEMGNLKESLSAAINYFNIYSFFENNREEEYRESTTLLCETFSEERFFKVLYIGLETAALVNDEKSLFKLMEYSNPSHKMVFIDSGAWLGDFAKMFAKSSHKEKYADTLKMLSNRN